MLTRKAYLLIAMVIGSYSLLMAQDPMQIMCNTQVVTQPSTQRGGRYITASGSLNVLFI
jgi:hypothetical protein